mmetsp:Transcript_3116/g.8843  ORF Transcript_3116/g.8843 Transcript_3116/m.8843 type:complete len:757 (+) Transcript_3116:1300-3570(+)
MELGDQLLGRRPIPAGEASWGVTSRCLFQTEGNAEITVFAHSPHMHWVGHRLWSEKIASGGEPNDDGVWEFDTFAGTEPLAELGRIDAYDANLQRMYTAKPPFSIVTGDLVSTTCVFDVTQTTKPVSGGPGSNDEMCIHFMMYYPARALDRPKCGSVEMSHQASWPAEQSSVTDSPELLSELLEPHANLPLGYESTANACDLEDISFKCGVEDISDQSQWTLDKICNTDGVCPGALMSCQESIAIVQQLCEMDGQGNIVGPKGGGPPVSCDWDAATQACGFETRLMNQWDYSKMCPSEACPGEYCDCATMVGGCVEDPEAMGNTCILRDSVLTDECATAADPIIPLLSTDMAFTPSMVQNTVDVTCTDTCQSQIESILDDGALYPHCCRAKWVANCMSPPLDAEPTKLSGALLGGPLLVCDIVNNFGADRAAAQGECAAMLEDPTCAGIWSSWESSASDPNFQDICAAAGPECASNILDTCGSQSVLDLMDTLLPPPVPSSLEKKLGLLVTVDRQQLMDTVCPKFNTPQCGIALASCLQGLQLFQAQLLPINWVVGCLQYEPAAPDSTLAPTPAPTQAPTPSPTIAPNTEVKILKASTIFADLSVDSFDDEKQDIFRENVAVQVQVPKMWVEILSLQAGSVKVDWQVTVLKEDEDKLADLESQLEAGAAFFDSSFGEAVVVGAFVLPYCRGPCSQAYSLESIALYSATLPPSRTLLGKTPPPSSVSPQYGFVVNVDLVAHIHVPTLVELSISCRRL